MKKILKFVGYLLGILILIRLSYSLFFSIYWVATDSMEPTIKKGNYIMASKFHYTFFNLDRNDMVVFKPIENIFQSGPWIHRIIAISGDVVSIKKGLVTVNGSNVLFPEIHHKDLEIRVQKGYIFQKGDNKETIAGVVPEEAIIGKVIFNFSK